MRIGYFDEIRAQVVIFLHANAVFLLRGQDNHPFSADMGTASGRYCDLTNVTLTRRDTPGSDAEVLINRPNANSNSGPKVVLSSHVTVQLNSVIRLFVGESGRRSVVVSLVTTVWFCHTTYGQIK